MYRTAPLFMPNVQLQLRAPVQGKQFCASSVPAVEEDTGGASHHLRAEILSLIHTTGMRGGMRGASKFCYNYINKLLSEQKGGNKKQKRQNKRERRKENSKEEREERKEKVETQKDGEG